MKERLFRDYFHQGFFARGYPSPISIFRPISVLTNFRGPEGREQGMHSIHAPFLIEDRAML